MYPGITIYKAQTVTWMLWVQIGTTIAEELAEATGGPGKKKAWERMQLSLRIQRRFLL